VLFALHGGRKRKSQGADIGHFCIWHAPCIRSACNPAASTRCRLKRDELPPGRAAASSKWGAEPMENALLIGLSRQSVLQRELDVIANNLANQNTTGFKQDISQFEEYLMPVARQNNFRPTDSRLSYVRDGGTVLDLRPGPMQQTGNPLDVAIQGDGFLAVQTPQGERYTRNGALQLNADGELVTAQGYQVLGDGGPIQFQQQDSNIAISAEGSVSVRSGGVANVSVIRGKLRIVNFPQQQRLQKDGENLFVTPADMAAADAPKAYVLQGAIEKSNVDSVTEMTRMIDVSRSYSMIATLLKNEGDLHKTAIQQLAEVPTS
jgi:flagellar basal-body rod protein FlgF